MLCESDTGYLVSFILYCGRGTKYPPPETEPPKRIDDFSNPSKVVLSLSSSILNQGYCIIVDNLYTSPELASVLLDDETGCYGALTKERVSQKLFDFFPKDQLTGFYMRATLAFNGLSFEMKGLLFFGGKKIKLYLCYCQNSRVK